MYWDRYHHNRSDECSLPYANYNETVNFLKNIVVKLGRGELVEEKQGNFSNDEIGEMSVAMDKR